MSLSARVRLRIVSTSGSIGGKFTAVDRTISPVGCLLVETMAIVRSGAKRLRAGEAQAVRRSKARKQSQFEMETLADSRAGSERILTCEKTDPAFWLSPV